MVLLVSIKYMYMDSHSCLPSESRPRSPRPCLGRPRCTARCLCSLVPMKVWSCVFVFYVVCRIPISSSVLSLGGGVVFLQHPSGGRIVKDAGRLGMIIIHTDHQQAENFYASDLFWYKPKNPSCKRCVCRIVGS